MTPQVLKLREQNVTSSHHSEHYRAIYSQNSDFKLQKKKFTCGLILMALLNKLK